MLALLVVEVLRVVNERGENVVAGNSDLRNDRLCRLCLE